MAIILSWDLFIGFFFAVVAAYSFIIGKHETLKILIAVYIAILATQGIGNIFARLTQNGQPFFRVLQVLGVDVSVNFLSTSKLVFFMSVVVAVALKGGFSITYGPSHSSLIALISTLLFGLSTAGIIMMGLITLIAGAPLLDPSLSQNLLIIPLMGSSRFVQFMVFNQDLWFALPALLLIGFGMVKEGGVE